MSDVVLSAPVRRQLRRAGLTDVRVAAAVDEETGDNYVTIPAAAPDQTGEDLISADASAGAAPTDEQLTDAADQAARRLAEDLTGGAAIRQAARAHLLRCFPGARWADEDFLIIDDDIELRMKLWDTTASTCDGDLWLEDIEVSVPGTGVGSVAIEALRAMADRRGVALWVGPVVNEPVWEQFEWLTDSGQDDYGDPIYVYRPG